MKAFTKISLRTVSLLAVFALAIPVLARPHKVYHYYHNLDFDRDAKDAVTLNLMDDGINLPENYDSFGYGVKFVLRPGETFRVASRANPGSDGAVTCKYSRPVRIPLSKGRTLIKIDLEAGVNTDDGSSCDYLIQLNNGKRVLVNVYEIGT